MANAVTDTNDGLSCFVIGPIGDELAPIGSENRKRWEDAIEVWETVIAPACAAVDLHPLRADQITEAGEIQNRLSVTYVTTTWLSPTSQTLTQTSCMS